VAGVPLEFPLAGPAAQTEGRALLARWREPHRRYHGERHLRDVLATATLLLRSPEPAPAAGTELELPVLLAAWWHDAVYNPAGSANEEASARLAEQVLPRCGAPGALSAEVARLVRLTADHDPGPGDLAGEVLCDADLAVLARPPAAYAGYVAAVRAEYAALDEPAWRAGRTQVLRSLLCRPRLFRTTPAARWEQPARRNLEAELSGLRPD